MRPEPCLRRLPTVRARALPARRIPSRSDPPLDVRPPPRRGATSRRYPSFTHSPTESRDVTGSVRAEPRPSGKVDASAVVERGVLSPRDVPDVPFRVAPAEAATPERLARRLEQLRTLDLLQRLVDAHALVVRGEVDGEREAAEAFGRRPELRFVARRRVEADHDPVRALERAMALVAAGRLGPAEVAEETRHALDIAAGEGDQADARRELH